MLCACKKGMFGCLAVTGLVAGDVVWFKDVVHLDNSGQFLFACRWPGSGGPGPIDSPGNQSAIGCIP
jgi:hypothetical protein